MIATDHEAHLMNDTGDDLRVQESLVGERTAEDEAGAERMTGTDRDHTGSPGEDLAHTPSLRLHEKPSILNQPPITPRRKCATLALHPAPDPALHQDPALVHAPGPDPGLAVNQAVAKKRNLLSLSLCLPEPESVFV